ncbi:MAG: Gfo/Idh/MocA family oxidoreductase [Planctomycetes bacterium]|nr:Gfo/Idh/MocA family oxidoreductase [Planctomycetota bacterium]MBL7146132.1 Gfo/Idh/MocA family oxidoreductase [Phycisphaerae bacterium]
MKDSEKLSKKQNRKISRRDFMSAAAVAAAFTFVPRHVLGGARYTSPSEKLNVACIGVSGMGGSDVSQMRTENLVAFCDVDWGHAAGTFKRYPNVKKYRDFRKMLDKEGKNIDAVTVSTPDNIHAVAAMRAIKMRKHVYCQKPLAHDVFEVRQLTEAARKYNVMTQMGIQIHAEDTVKVVVEIVKSGMIGEVRKVDIFSDKNWGGGTRPDEGQPLPETLDWDLWLGPAPWRPYHKVYVPGNWRRWWDFGTGTLGDMGCHIIDPVFWALDLKYPISVEAHPGKFNDETYPEATVVRWEFPERGNLPPVTVTWYDGDNRPFLPKELEPGRKLPGQGGLYYGEKGTIMAPHMGGPRLIPESKMKGFKVEPFLPRGVNHYEEWIRACKGGPKPSASFDYSGPLSETILLGNVAARAGQKLFWDGPNFKVTNMPDAEKYLKREYREGWSL